MVPGIGPGMAPSPMEQHANQLHCIGGLQHYRFCLGCAFHLRSLFSSVVEHVDPSSALLPLWFCFVFLLFFCLWSSPVGKAEGDEREGVPGSQPQPGGRARPFLLFGCPATQHRGRGRPWPSCRVGCRVAIPATLSLPLARVVVIC